jgi:hypothetical protein
MINEFEAKGRPDGAPASVPAVMLSKVGRSAVPSPAARRDLHLSHEERGLRPQCPEIGAALTRAFERFARGLNP